MQIWCCISFWSVAPISEYKKNPWISPSFCLGIICKAIYMHKLKKKKRDNKCFKSLSKYPEDQSLCGNKPIHLIFFFFFLSFEMLQIKQPTEGRLRQSHAERSLSPSQHMTWHCCTGVSWGLIQLTFTTLIYVQFIHLTLVGIHQGADSFRVVLNTALKYEKVGGDIVKTLMHLSLQKSSIF